MNPAIEHPKMGLRLGRRVVRCLPLGRMTMARAVVRVAGTGISAVLSEYSQPPIRFAADLHEFIDRQVFFNGVFEPSVTSLLRDALQPGWTFVDVGANTGYYSLLAASLVGSNGRVVAFEPDANCLQRLRTNTALNPAIHIEIVPDALTDHVGTAPFWGSQANGANQGGGSVLSGSGRATEVRTTTFDACIDTLGIRVVDFLKMDIEGAEGLALAGMDRSLRTGRVRQLLIEVHRQALEQCGQSSGGIFEHLSAYGYRGARVRAIRSHGWRKYVEAEYRLEAMTQADRATNLAHYLFTKTQQ